MGLQANDSQQGIIQFTGSVIDGSTVKSILMLYQELILKLWVILLPSGKDPKF